MKDNKFLLISFIKKILHYYVKFEIYGSIHYTEIDSQYKCIDGSF